MTRVKGQSIPRAATLFGCKVGQAKDFTGKVWQALGLGLLWGRKPCRGVFGYLGATSIGSYFYYSEWWGVTMPSFGKRNRQWGRGFCGFWRSAGG